MKNILASSIAIAFLLFMNSCSQDFKVAAPYKNITVGYGLVNMSDTAHYIRIEKAFLDESKSTLDMAKIPDSSYYNNLEVHMKETMNNNVISDIILNRVDLANEGFPAKDSGAFFATPNYAYKYKKVLNSTYKYRLVINNKATGDIDSADADIISNDSNKFYSNEFGQSTGLFIINFANPKNDFILHYRVPDFVKIVQGIIRFHWVNKNTLTNVQTDDSADWVFYSGAVATTMSVKNETFYPVLVSLMKAAPNNTLRYMDSCDIFIWAGTEQLSNYLSYSFAKGGLTGDQIKPNYTNFKGANALGLFTSRCMIKDIGRAIAPATLDSLKLNAITQQLKIVGLSDH